MTNLSKLPSRKVDLDAALEKAAAHTAECEGIIIIMQRKTPKGGFFYYTNSDMRLETVVWYTTSLQHHILELAKDENDAF
jgi:hypothetical protein